MNQDQTFFEQIYKKHYKLLYAVGYKVLHDHEDVEDAMQHCMINIYNNMDLIRNLDENKVKPFLLIVMRNESIKIYNRNKKSHAVNIDRINDISDTSSDIENTVIDNDFENVVPTGAKLKQEEKDLIVLKYHYGYSHKEISHILNQKSSAVRKRLSRALDKIRVFLKYKGRNDLNE